MRRMYYGADWRGMFLTYAALKCVMPCTGGYYIDPPANDFGDRP